MGEQRQECTAAEHAWIVRGQRYFSQEAAICPYCDHKHDPSDSEGAFYEDGDVIPWQCESCGEDFEIEAHCSWSWQTRREDQPRWPFKADGSVDPEHADLVAALIDV